MLLSVEHPVLCVRYCFVESRLSLVFTVKAFCVAMFVVVTLKVGKELYTFANVKKRYASFSLSHVTDEGNLRNFLSKSIFSTVCLG